MPVGGPLGSAPAHHRHGSDEGLPIPWSRGFRVLKGFLVSRGFGDSWVHGIFGVLGVLVVSGLGLLVRVLGFGDFWVLVFGGLGSKGCWGCLVCRV